MIIKIQYDLTLTETAYAVMAFEEYTLLVVNPLAQATMPTWLREHLQNSLLKAVQHHKPSRLKVIDLCQEREIRRPVAMTGTH